MNNKIIETQEILFKEMQRLDDDNMLDIDNKKTERELSRATAMFNVATVFMKSLNANMAIMNMAHKTGEKYESLMNKLGV